jgi:hypothetical protein
MNFTTFDIMGDLMFAETFDCLNDSKLHPWISLIFASVKGITLMAVMNQFSLIWKISEFILPEYLRDQILRAINITAEKADRRIEKGTTRPDFMSALLKHGLNDGKGRSINENPIMTRAEIHSNSMLYASYYPLSSKHKLTILPVQNHHGWKRNNCLTSVGMYILPMQKPHRHDQSMQRDTLSILGG